MRVFLRNTVFLTGCLGLLIGSTGCGGPDPAGKENVAPPVEQAPAPVPGGVAIPYPDLSKAQPAVRSILEAKQSALQEAVEAGRVDADLLGETGRYYLAASFSDAAAACFTNALVLEPDRFEWNYFLAHIQRGNGNYPESVDRFQKALEQEPDSVAVLVWLGRSLLETGQIDAAKARFRKALEINPESSSAMAGLGKAAAAEGDDREAVQDLEKALEWTPGATSLHYPLGMAYKRLGNRAEAEKHLALRGDIEIYPLDPWMEPLKSLLATPTLYSERGGRAYAEGDFAQAVKEFREGLAMDPDDPLLHLNLGSALYEAGEKEEAEKKIRAALALDGRYAEALYSLGAIRENEGNDREAGNYYRRSLAIRSDLVQANRRLAVVLVRSGRLDEAVEAYSAAIRLDPRQAPARLGLVMALVRAGKFVEAEAALDEARSALPDQPAFTHALARLLAGCPDPAGRDGARALKLLDTIRNGSPNSDMAETIAMALARVGRFETAARWQEKVVEAAEKAGRNRLAQAMRKPLEAYRAGRPWNLPWRAEDPVFRLPRDAHPYQPRRTRQ